jgi:oligopeptide transport system ATP-binding protein
LDVSLRSRNILLETLRKRLELSFFLISHDIAAMKHLAHRIAVMYFGVIVEEAPTAYRCSQLRALPIRAFLASVPQQPWDAWLGS